MDEKLMLGDVCIITNAVNSGIPISFTNSLCIIEFIEDGNDVALIRCFNILKSSHVIWNIYKRFLGKI